MEYKLRTEIKEKIITIKKLVGELNCMGTYVLVELELTEIEKRINLLVKDAFDSGYESGVCGD